MQLEQLPVELLQVLPCSSPPQQLPLHGGAEGSPKNFSLMCRVSDSEGHCFPFNGCAGFSFLASEFSFNS